MIHVHLLIDHRDGRPHQEPVHAESLGDEVFRLLSSPGFVQGIAAGDEFRFVEDDGRFVVTKRGGNLAVQFFSTEPVAPLMHEFDKLATRTNGAVDGHIERGVVLTIPLSTGFAAIEREIAALCARHASVEWHYANVYDPKDGVTPLAWWKTP